MVEYSLVDPVNSLNELAMSVPYGQEFAIRTSGEDDDSPSLPELLGFSNHVFSASDGYGIGSHEDESGGGDYHLFYTINLVSKSPSCPNDDDLDNINNNIDTQPNIYSDEFSDKDINGGTSFGIITHHGAQQAFAISDAPNPSGFLIESIQGFSDSSAQPATIEICRRTIGFC